MYRHTFVPYVSSGTGPPGSPGQTVFKRLRVCILVGLQLRRRSVVSDSKQSATRKQLNDEFFRTWFSGQRRRSSPDAREKVMAIVLICLFVTVLFCFHCIQA